MQEHSSRWGMVWLCRFKFLSLQSYYLSLKQKVKHLECSNKDSTFFFFLSTCSNSNVCCFVYLIRIGSLMFHGDICPSEWHEFKGHLVGLSGRDFYSVTLLLIHRWTGWYAKFCFPFQNYSCFFFKTDYRLYLWLFFVVCNCASCLHHIVKLYVLECLFLLLVGRAPKVYARRLQMQWSMYVEFLDLWLLLLHFFSLSCCYK